MLPKIISKIIVGKIIAIQVVKKHRTSNTLHPFTFCLAVFFRIEAHGPVFGANIVMTYWRETHGRMVTSSRQITEVKQRRARLVLGWVTAARVTLPAMCGGVGQALHITPPLSTQQ